ncbi:ABC transporter ATP-binding protein [Kordiimonas sp. SCSIO 12603]|uniref:ABC transporter ATP-binding protein n=1 Tax=Kordiimonas sp. SCSIO 12603 TaxID=2829596 RepID=UPI002106A95A|nr:ABC transporter ATP-binding protein [Kordiimonas sp. SCSIO 12603]UTW59779.1 ABC transporter ATP-binding protein [Kordiimonas sp. SCSIO 12603]
MIGLEINNLGVVLSGREIVRGASFTVKPGEIVGLIGPNGAGKSTVIKAILGLVEKASGDVLLSGVGTDEFEAKERARKISYVPQGAPIHWPLTAERTVALGRTPHLNPWQDMRDEDQTAIRKAMKQTDCWHLKDRLVTNLSGGERARVMLARTMAVGAEYMLADEPTASLDPFHQLQVMDIMKAQAKAGVGVLIVMHDLSLALQTCDKLVLMHEGAVLAKGTSAEVLTDENLKTAFGVAVTRWSENGLEYIAPRATG